MPWPYGGFYLEAMDAHGGWVGTAADLLKVAAAVDGNSARPDVISGSSRAQMGARPALPTWNGTGHWYGFGWSANTNGNWWHTGSLPGSESLLVRSAYQGLHWAVLLNARTPQSGTYMAALDSAMWDLAVATTSWPTHDLFGLFVATEGGTSAAPFSVQVAPNPAAAGATVRLTLPAAAAVRAEVFDVLGRRVGTVQNGLLGDGTHALPLDGLALLPGLYVLRVTAGASPRIVRFTVAR